MEKMIDFTVFCLESYKQSHNMTGKIAFETFNEYKVFDYIQSFYEDRNILLEILTFILIQEKIEFN